MNTTNIPKNQMHHELIILTTTIKQNIIIFMGLLWAFFLPVAPLLIVCGLAIFADTVMGLIKAYKLKEKITSRKLSRLISKMLLYQLTIILFFFLEKILLHEFVEFFSGIDLLLTKLVTTVLISVEILSFNESFTAVAGFSLWDKFVSLVKRGGEAKKLVEDNLGDVFDKKADDKPADEPEIK